jgi:hypothetical protein
MRHVCQKYGGACTTWYSEYQRYKKWDEKLDSRAAEKGTKKLASSIRVKILKKNVAIKIRETCEKTMLTPSNPIKATNLIVTA